ncbi:MAG: hypothetical protein E7618_06735, partial [Ruminococcaceae bacterium]|nr:hypothetical protein [Oscillospiraceae bacterium]
MVKHFSLLLLAILMILSVFCLASCNNTSTPSTGTEGTDESTDTTTDTEEDLPVRYEVAEKELVIPLYDWYRKTQRSFDGRGLVYWNNTMARKLNVNWINVFPSGKYKTRDASAPGAFLLDVDRIIEYTAKGLEESHSFGIKIMTSAPVAEIFDDTWKDYGYNPDDYKIWGLDKKPVAPSNNGISYGCNTNEGFLQFLYDYTEKVAKAGYDGCLYDGYTYCYNPGYYCQCPSCEASWATFSKEHLGQAKPLPSRTQDLENSEEGRVYLFWKLDTQVKMYTKFRDIGRQYVPDFEVYINSTMYDIALSYFYLNGLDVTSSEFKHAMGRESSLFMYEQNNALTNKQLISFVNQYTKQFEHEHQYYTAMAEAYATGNAMCHAEVSRTQPHEFYLNDTSLGFARLVTENEEAFTKTTSAAEAGILYSWQDTTFYQLKQLKSFYEAGGTNIRETFELCSSRRVASYMARQGIPFNYICAETNPSLAELQKRATIILPNLKLLDKTLEENLLAYVKAGGTLLVLGNDFAETYPEKGGIVLTARDYDVLEAWTGTSYANTANDATYTVGEGKIIVCKKYETIARDKSENNSHPTDAFLNALNASGAGRQVVIESAPREGYIETTLRTNAYGTRFYLHLINNNVTSNYTSKAYRVSMAIPEGATVADVTLASPYFEKAADANLTWEIKDGRLVM